MHCPSLMLLEMARQPDRASTVALDRPKRDTPAFDWREMTPQSLLNALPAGIASSMAVSVILCMNVCAQLC